jgi:hypothetical protein
MELYTDWEAALGEVLDQSIIEKTDAFREDLQSLHIEGIQDFFKAAFSPNKQKNSSFDYITDQRWRKFLLSVYYADLASYTKEADQVDLPRLWYILNRFPEGFTVWWIALDTKKYPVGYTGWYYVEADTFNHIAQMQNNKDIVITHRFFLPSIEKTPYLYLFNYSITPALHHSVYSRALIKDLAATLSNVPYEGIFCATVSPDGIRVAERFGMKPIGAIKTPEGTDGDRIYFLRKQVP